MINEHNKLKGRSHYIIKAGSKIEVLVSEEDYGEYLTVITSQDISVFIEDEEVELDWRYMLNERI